MYALINFDYFFVYISYKDIFILLPVYNIEVIWAVIPKYHAEHIDPFSFRPTMNSNANIVNNAITKTYLNNCSIKVKRKNCICRLTPTLNSQRPTSSPLLRTIIGMMDASALSLVVWNYTASASPLAEYAVRLVHAHPVLILKTTK